MNTRPKWSILITSLAISLGAGALSSLLTANSMEQYQTLYKPPLSPPGWAFPVVWTILFILMGIAAFMVYTTDTSEEERETALKLYGAQLIVNIFWSIIFFNLNAYLLAFAWLLFLWFMIFVTIRHFAAINRTAAYLLIPYLVWVTFAGYLNLAIAIYYVS